MKTFLILSLVVSWGSCNRPARDQDADVARAFLSDHDWFLDPECRIDPVPLSSQSLLDHLKTSNDMYSKRFKIGSGVMHFTIGDRFEQKPTDVTFDLGMVNRQDAEWNSELGIDCNLTSVDSSFEHPNLQISRPLFDTTRKFALMMLHKPSHGGAIGMLRSSHGLWTGIFESETSWVY